MIHDCFAFFIKHLLKKQEQSLNMNHKNKEITRTMKANMS